MYKDLKEYCEATYKTIFEKSNKKKACPVCGKRTFIFYKNDLEKLECFHPDYQVQQNRRKK